MDLKSELRGISPKKAVELQREMSARVSLESPFRTAEYVKTVVACDVGYSSDGQIAYASAVAMSLPELKIIRKKTVLHRDKKRFPYIPGLLSFREGPPMAMALESLGIEPDVYIFDGHGIAHPRRLGIASYMGVLLDKPSIGCGKSLLYGHFDEPPPGLRGGYTFLKDRSDDIIGVVLRTRPYVKPIFISPGNKMSFTLACDIIMNCTTKYRLPEPIRIADAETKKKLQ